MIEMREMTKKAREAKSTCSMARQIGRAREKRVMSKRHEGKVGINGYVKDQFGSEGIAWSMKTNLIKIIFSRRHLFFKEKCFPTNPKRVQNGSSINIAWIALQGDWRP